MLSLLSTHYSTLCRFLPWPLSAPQPSPAAASQTAYLQGPPAHASLTGPNLRHPAKQLHGSRTVRSLCRLPIRFTYLFCLLPVIKLLQVTLDTNYLFFFLKQRVKQNQEPGRYIHFPPLGVFYFGENFDSVTLKENTTSLCTADAF